MRCAAFSSLLCSIGCINFTGLDLGLDFIKTMTFQEAKPVPIYGQDYGELTQKMSLRRLEDNITGGMALCSVLLDCIRGAS